MDLHQLEYIVEIAKEKNISKAAEHLYISQPTLSIYLTKLEKNLGIKLFQRDNNMLTITEAGEQYAQTCRQILALRDELYGRLYPPEKETLRLGVLSSSAYVFGKVFREFKELYPQVALQPQIKKSHEICEDLARGSIDLGFITAYQTDLDVCFSEMNYAVIKDYELMLCIAKSNPVYQKLHVKDGVIQNEDLALLDEMSITVAAIPMIRSRILDDLVPTLGLRPKDILAFDALEFWSTNLCMENVYSFSPYSHVPDNIAQIALNFHPKIHKLLIYPRGKRLSNAERTFVAMVEKEFAEYPHYYYM